MFPQTQELLDAEELLRLAIQASETGRIEEALSQLKRALRVNPKYARAIYLMGALHAQIGLYERAKQEIEEALVLEPGIENARFQLGLLHITSGDLNAAENAWAPLDSLLDQHPLVLFKNGLLHIARDQFAQGVDLLKKGIERNTQYASLNRDMQKILDSIPVVNEVTGVETAAASADAKRKGKNIFLASYKKDEKEE